MIACGTGEKLHIWKYLTVYCKIVPLIDQWIIASIISLIPSWNVNGISIVDWTFVVITIIIDFINPIWDNYIWLYILYCIILGALVFLIVWCCFLWLWSIPLIILEYATGRYTRLGAVESMNDLAGPSFRFMGAWLIFVPFAIRLIIVCVCARVRVCVMYYILNMNMNVYYS